MSQVLTRRTSIEHKASLISTVLRMVSLHRQRRALMRLDDAQLQDIGISRAEAESEASRPAWELPQQRHC